MDKPYVVSPLAWERCLVRSQMKRALKEVITKEYNRITKEYNGKSDRVYYAEVYYDEVLVCIGSAYEMLFKSMIMDSEKYRNESTVPRKFHTHYIHKNTKRRQGLFNFLSDERKTLVRGAVAKSFQNFEDFCSLLDEEIDYQNRKQGGFGKGAEEVGKGWKLKGDMNTAIICLDHVYSRILRGYMLGAFQACISGYTLLHLDYESLVFFQEKMRDRELSQNEENWLKSLDLAYYQQGEEDIRDASRGA